MPYMVGESRLQRELGRWYATAMAIVTASDESVRAASRPTEAWRQSLKRAIRDPLDLCRRLDLPPELEPAAVRAAELFPLFAPLEFVARIRPRDPVDPLLLQVLPLGAEREDQAGFTADPVGDAAALRAAGLLQKYRGRALLLASGTCAVHCRYCFRRHFPYGESAGAADDWQAALEAIENDPTIEEIILSGGDPLTLVDEQLAVLVARLAEIPHVRRLRVHSRLPIVIPSRVTDDMLAWLCGTRLTPVMVIHSNHAAELDAAVADALARISKAGALLLNQAVLLRGVNDSADALADLSERLVDLRVTPYYLHQLDRVAGAAHFEVSETRGLELMAALRARLPGYAVPRYVREVAGETGKRVLA